MSVEENVRYTLGLLRRSIQMSGTTLLQLEERIGLGRGYLSQLFNGRIELKLRHILLILEELGIDPLVFFSMALPTAGRRPSELGEVFSGLQDALGEATGREMSKALGAADQPDAPDAALRDLVRGLVREVLDEEGRKGKEGNGDPPSGTPPVG